MPTASQEETVVVFGSTGAVGTCLIKKLSSEHPTWKIRAATRPSATAKKNTSPFDSLPNVTIVKGDPFRKEDVLELCKECSIIYCCVGFHKYETKYWADHWPLVVDNLLAAVTSADTKKKRKLIFCDNIYALGPGKDKHHKGGTVEPSLNTKAGIRAILHETFRKHIKEHPGTLAVVGAADFFGPGLTDTVILGDTFTGKIVHRQSPMAFFTADKKHDFAYVPDFAQALAIAGVSDEALDHFWICPHAVHDKTMTTIAKDIARLAGYTETEQAKVSVSIIPSFLVTMLSPFMSFMKEFKQMKAWWDQDYTVDDSDFCNTFNVKATPYEKALQDYVEFYKSAAEEKK